MPCLVAKIPQGCVLPQVKIAELAENMIRMAGKIPYPDIDITFTGARPGEKLFEELFTELEAQSLERVGKILRCQPDQCDWDEYNA